MGLLDLPPELLSYILALAYPSAVPFTLSLVHRSFTPHTQSLAFRDVLLHSTQQVHKLLPSPALRRYGGSIRRLRFIPLDGDGGGRGGVGRGIGTAETLDGRAVSRLLDELRAHWDKSKAEGAEGRGIEVLDVAFVDPLRPEVLEGEWLSSKFPLLPSIQL